MHQFHGALVSFAERRDIMMKVCKHGLESIWVNHANGEVRICGWTSYVIGTLTENTIEELWHGEKAEEFRKSMLDGSYCFCDRKECPYCANESLDETQIEYIVPQYPLKVNLSYEENCNYCCVFCRKEKYVPGRDEGEKIKKIENELNKFINNVDTIAANGVGEVFCSPSALSILGKINNPNIKIELESNGSLFNESNWKKLSNLENNFITVAITVHSFQKDIYQELSGTSLPVENIIKNLYFIKSLREKGVINSFELATVVCQRNFREMPEYVRYALKEFNPDSIRLRFFKPYAVQDRATEWFLDVRNPYHPEYKEFKKIMENPVFQNDKVWKWQGETLSDQKEHPYYAEHQKTILLSNLLQAESIGREKIKNWMNSENIKTIGLYGNSIEGRAFASFLMEKEIPIDVFYDTYPQFSCKYKDIVLIKPNKDNLTTDAIIITALTWKEKIAKYLQELNYKGKVYILDQFVNSIICDNGYETGRR